MSRRHEWTDEEGRWEALDDEGDAVLTELLLPSTLRPSKDPHNAAACEILRLAEEVERLKAENLGLRRDLDTKDEQEFANGEEEGVAAEGARIRRELLEEFSGVNWESKAADGHRFGRIKTIVDRIVPGED